MRLSLGLVSGVKERTKPVWAGNQWRLAFMWKPNWAQWIVIWLFSLLSLFLWVESARLDDVGGRMVISLVIVGALLVWNLQNTRSR